MLCSLLSNFPQELSVKSKVCGGTNMGLVKAKIGLRPKALALCFLLLPLASPCWLLRLASSCFFCLFLPVLLLLLLFLCCLLASLSPLAALCRRLLLVFSSLTRFPLLSAGVRGFLLLLALHAFKYSRSSPSLKFSFWHCFSGELPLVPWSRQIP